MPKKAKQVEMYKDDPLDSAIAQVADKYVELIEERAENKEFIELQERHLSQMMKNMKLLRFKHHGHIIELIHKDTDRIRLKKEKELRAARQRTAKKKKVTKSKPEPAQETEE